uniref:ATP synthase peripheral stalk subunit F6, mitochondrial n=1 Tax=Vombatus ursinus TaxID=29139 RepID=A0A4X2K530_VOMUR
NKELNPVFFLKKTLCKQDLFKGPVGLGPEYQQELDRELLQFKRMYDGADMDPFPTFTLEDPNFEETPKSQAWGITVEYVLLFGYLS